MISDLLLYFFCSVLSLLLIFGITAWATICLCADTEHGCVTVIVAGPKDNDTMKQISAVVHSDRLLNRTSCPIVLDYGLPPELHAELRRLAETGRIVLFPDDSSGLAAAIRSSAARYRDNTDNSIKT